MPACRYIGIALLGFAAGAIPRSVAAEEFLQPGTTILCEREAAVGFNWDNGRYKEVSFKPGQKHLFKKVGRGDCPHAAIEEDTNRTVGGFVARHTQICLMAQEFGGEPAFAGEVCWESITGEPDQLQHSISCKDEFAAPNIRLSPNGFYHLAYIHAELSRKPEDGRKDSQYVEWGLCSVISE
jgi:hypothetical protein